MSRVGVWGGKRGPAASARPGAHVHAVKGVRLDAGQLALLLVILVCEPATRIILRQFDPAVLAAGCTAADTTRIPVPAQHRNAVGAKGIAGLRHSLGARLDAARPGSKAPCDTA